MPLTSPLTILIDSKDRKLQGNEFDTLESSQGKHSLLYDFHSIYHEGLAGEGDQGG